jgi:hypothetical protein
VRLFAILCLTFACVSLRAADNEAPEGFVSLFNGKDLTGWKIPEGDNGHWKVVDGVIDYDAQSEAPNKSARDLMHTTEYTNYILQVDWRIKETPYINPNVFYVLPDGSEARDVTGKLIKFALPDSDSGIILSGNVKYQVNIWCWPIGSGEMYGLRKDNTQPPEVRQGATPRTQADKPVGEWNRFVITVKDGTVNVVLNGKEVLPTFKIPNFPVKGAVGLQHHGGMKDGKWSSPPSLLQFKNIFVKELK